MDLPSTTSLHTSGRAGNGNLEATHGVTQSRVANSLPFRPILSPDHEGIESHSPSDENMEEENESALRQPTLASKKTKREKQREKRKLKRALKRAAAEVDTDQKDQGDITQDTRRIRHRPSSAQRSATTLMRMDQWSRLFLNRTSSLSSLTLDCATAEAMSKAVEKTWGGKSRKRTFRSAQEPDRFVSVKDQELRYLKTSLRRASLMQQLPSKNHQSKAHEELMSSLEPLFRAWEVDREEEIGKDEVLQEATRFFTDTIIPCLEAQLVQLRLRLNSARILEGRLDRVGAELADREEVECRLAALAEDRTYILPICPAWNQLGKDMDEIQRSLHLSKSLPDLREEQEHVMIEYRRSLEWQ
ncbi:hypothetical protein CEP54_014378 [Fusarium duplospermum]|uniref:Uncharacterized protein n=1 Tax=Fusarium duplospermum TaxID=1325734 RepID=A0A428NWV4_9HYPO|nr:hypothetical protein CEP54_014378 [Fusarium duplospermum]